MTSLVTAALAAVHPACLFYTFYMHSIHVCIHNGAVKLLLLLALAGYFVIPMQWNVTPLDEFILLLCISVDIIMYTVSHYTYSIIPWKNMGA